MAYWLTGTDERGNGGGWTDEARTVQAALVSAVLGMDGDAMDALSDALCELLAGPRH